MEAGKTLRVDWPDFAWIEYQACEGAGWLSRLGAASELAMLVPITGTVVNRRTRRPEPKTIGFELLVGSNSEGRLIGRDPRVLIRFAEGILRRRYPQHFRGRPGDQAPTASPSRTNPRVSGFVRRSPDS